jgi:N-acetylglutamate synthase-like GNAT family acetyltransferase
MAVKGKEIKYTQRVLEEDINRIISDIQKGKYGNDFITASARKELKEELIKATKSKQIIIVKKEGKTIGFLGWDNFSKEQPKTANIQIYLKEKEQGKKIGSTLLKLGERKMAEKGFKNIQTFTPTAQRFFLKQKYSPVNSFGDFRKKIYRKKIIKRGRR